MPLDSSDAHCQCGEDLHHSSDLSNNRVFIRPESDTDLKNDFGAIFLYLDGAPLVNLLGNSSRMESCSVVRVRQLGSKFRTRFAVGLQRCGRRWWPSCSRFFNKGVASVLCRRSETKVSLPSLSSATKSRLFYFELDVVCDVYVASFNGAAVRRRRWVDLSLSTQTHRRPAAQCCRRWELGSHSWACKKQLFVRWTRSWALALRGSLVLLLLSPFDFILSLTSAPFSVVFSRFFFFLKKKR